MFATTYSNMQTAADKCEEMEDGYAQCSQFLFGKENRPRQKGEFWSSALSFYCCQEHEHIPDQNTVEGTVGLELGTPEWSLWRFEVC